MRLTPPVSDADRPNPDALLSSIQREESASRRGKLKVFLGMAPGVGKTFAMLEAAQRELKAGRDVVIGYVETHGRKETDSLTQGLPLIPRRSIEHRGIALTEFDLDATLARQPQLGLVDELAHTNAPGSRHPKRYQDVAELLDAGIDVFTTLNVQHVESRAEIVREVTGATIQETVPDSVLDHAEIELVDLPPGELLQRLADGKVYVPDRAQAATQNFFRTGNLTALRELALRLAAEHVGQNVRDYLQTRQIAGPWKTGQRLLVAISPSPLSESMARWTRRFADNLQAPWMAIHVDRGRPLSDEEQARLQKNLTLARELGAEVISTTDQDVVGALLRIARQHNVTQIVVGKPAGWHVLDLFRGGSMLNRLIRESGGIDVHCVRAESAGIIPRPAPLKGLASSNPRQYLSVLLVVALATGCNLLFERWTGYHVLSLVYLLAVVGLGVFVGRGPVLVGAAASALLWNFLFVPPYHTLLIANLHDALMCGALFIVALAMGQLTARIRAQQVSEREREERATALYLLTRELAEAKDLAQLLGVVVRQLGDVFRSEVAILLPDEDDAGTLTAYPFNTLEVKEKEIGVAAWAYRNRRPAGKNTDTLPSAQALYLPLLTTAGCAGVAGLKPRSAHRWSLQERNLLDNFIRQIALVLDRQRLSDAEQEAKLVAESERLGKALLNSVSHELRTPIAAITTAATSLSDLPRDAAPDLSSGLIEEVVEASHRLNRLVGNLLDITRLESGHVKPKMEWCDAGDLIQVLMQRTARQLRRHRVSSRVEGRLPLVRMDFVLMEQALSNLLSNAAAHTPPGAAVEVSARVDGDELVLSVADNGRGLPLEPVERVFDKFFRGPGAPTGGTGLGLSIVKGFVEAQGGRVIGRNRAGGGAEFVIRLPVGQPPPVAPEAVPQSA